MRTNLQRIALSRLTGFALLLLSLGQHAASVLAATELSGTSAPDFVLKSVSGENHRLSEYRGEVVVVSFWATWCGDCRAQLTELNEWRSTYEGAGLKLLAISLDRSFDDVRGMADALGLEYPVLHDGTLDVSKLYDVDDLPVAVLIDRDGVVRDVVEGYRRSRAQELLERVKDLLRE